MIARAYVLGVLLLVHILNFVDRNILAIVAGDIYGPGEVLMAP